MLKLTHKHTTLTVISLEGNINFSLKNVKTQNQKHFLLLPYIVDNEKLIMLPFYRKLNKTVKQISQNAFQKCF